MKDISSKFYGLGGVHMISEKSNVRMRLMLCYISYAHFQKTFTLK